MKRLVLCFDGTWEMRASLRGRHKGSYPTNVEKIQIAVLRQDTSVVPAVPQVTAYYPGIGTGRLSHYWGGMTGAGISRTICEAYSFIVDNFILEEDQLFLFGFSRGAYTARSLSGFMRWLGVLRKQDLRGLPEFYRDYRRPPGKRSSAIGKRLQDIRQGDQQFPIRFLGVWDTVGSLGIPVPVIGRIFNWKKLVGFHDVALSPNVSHAYQALAVHERRWNFAPDIWSSKYPGQKMEQAWFPGTHCDVGGGNQNSGLSDIAFRWMVCHAEQCDLSFDHTYLARANPNCCSSIYNSSQGQWAVVPRWTRTFGAGMDECRHRSVDDRMNYIAANPSVPHRSKWRAADHAAKRQLLPCRACTEPEPPCEAW
ncbi:MAG: DUF2235 domain-containing protein [Vicinamibacterales bacterium]|jgi:hypothetical protein